MRAGGVGDRARRRRRRSPCPSSEIPSPILAFGSGYEREFGAARDELSRHPLRRGELVEITGIGFFDYYAHGHASNGLELHPVIAVRFVGGS